MRGWMAAPVVVGLALAALAGSCSSSSDKTPTSPGGNNGGSNSGTSVSISGFAFVPAVDTVKAGATVTWTNQDAVAHTVTADDGTFGSAHLGNGATFSRTFNTAGTFTYHCAIHASMHGTVVVQ